MTRGERRNRTERHVASRIREWEEVTHQPFEVEAGRQRKGPHAFPCGNPRCGLCHREKFPKRQRTRQETRALQEAAAEFEHPECWPEVVGRELDNLLYWEDDDWAWDQRKRARETFPL